MLPPIPTAFAIMRLFINSYGNIRFVTISIPWQSYENSLLLVERVDDFGNLPGGKDRKQLLPTQGDTEATPYRCRRFLCVK